MAMPISTAAAAPGGAVAEPDAHGQAALMLAESMLHSLVDTSVLTHAEALGILVTAIEVKREIATAAGESAVRMQASLDLLTRIHASFATDEAPPRRDPAATVLRRA